MAEVRKKTLCELCFHYDVCDDRLSISYDDEKALVFCNDFKGCEEWIKVVRCKDCKWYKWDEWDGGLVCYQHGRYPYANDFCNYGERKDNG